MAVMEVDLRKYFNPQAIAEILKELPPLKTPIMDTFYPEEVRKQHQLPVLGVSEITAVIENVPVVRRGTAAVPLEGGDQSITYIEPQPIEVSMFIGAKELNDLKLLGDVAIDQYIRDKIDWLRRAIRRTEEALAAQSLTGTISYPMKTNAGLDTYQVTFGQTLAYTPAKLWDAADIKVADILKQLMEISSLLNQQGWGRVKFVAGKDAYAALANVVLGAGQTNVKAEVTEAGVTIAGFTVSYIDAAIKDLTSGQATPAIDAKKLLAVAMDAPFRHYFCAIDDIEAGLVAMPFYATQEVKKNPSGVEIVGKSKPLPVPVPKAICWATVVS